MLYQQQNYVFFLDRMSSYQAAVLQQLYEHDEASITKPNRNNIIDSLSSEYSKPSVINALQSLCFVGFIDFHTKGNKHLYFTTDEGYRFSEFVRVYHPTQPNYSEDSE